MLRIRIGSVVVLVLLLSPFGYGGALFGILHGVTRSAEGVPLSGVQVVVQSLDENTDRSIVSNDQGAFLVENLKPGRYQLTANKAGFASSSATSVELAPQQSLRVDMTLASPSGSKGMSDPVRVAAAPGMAAFGTRIFVKLRTLSTWTYWSNSRSGKPLASGSDK